MSRTLIPVLLLAIAVSGCRSSRESRARIDPVLTSFIPGDTTMLAGVRMDEIRETPLYQKLSAQRRLPALENFRERTGFDPSKDVNQILISSDGKDTVVMARGRFQGAKLPATEQSTYKGYKLYGEQEGAFVIIDPSTALAGTQTGIRAAIDQYKSGNRSISAGPLLTRANAIVGENQVWAVAIGTESLLGLTPSGSPNAASLTKLLSPVESFTFTADLRTGLTAVATGECRTEQDAKTLGDTVRGLVGLARLGAPRDQPDLLHLYDDISVNQQQRSVKLAANIPQDLFDRLLGSTKSQPAE